MTMTNPRDFFAASIRSCGDFTVGDYVVVTDVDEERFAANGWISALAPNVWDDNIFVKVVLTDPPEAVESMGAYGDIVFTHRQLTRR
jgi:hypothetical protein